MQRQRFQATSTMFSSTADIEALARELQTILAARLIRIQQRACHQAEAFFRVRRCKILPPDPQGFGDRRTKFLRNPALPARNRLPVDTRHGITLTEWTEPDEVVAIPD